MNRLKFFALVAGLLCCIGAMGQEVPVSGRLADKADKTPLIGANVVLLRNDSSVANNTVTDIGGNFSMDVAAGSYIMRILYIGYPDYRRTVNVPAGGLSMGTIQLAAKPTTLQEVQVTALQNRVTQKDDTTEYNADAYKTNPDASAEDLVTKMPGITMENGTVKAQGEDVKKVTVDGREFFGNDATAALRNLPAEVIDRIQVFDKLSEQSQFTGFNDGNTEKSINIITKTGKNNGQFGKVYAGYGTENRYMAGGNISLFNGDQRISIIALSNNVNQQNFSTEDILGVTGGNERRGLSGGGSGGTRGGRGGGGGFRPRGGGSDPSDFMIGQQGGINTTHSTGINYSDKWGKKVTVSGSYFFNNTKNETDASLRREYFTPGEASTIYTEDIQSESDNTNHRFSLRLQYDIDSNNSLIVTPRLSFQNNTGRSTTTALSTLSTGEDVSNIFSNLSTANDGYNLNNDLLYRHKFKKQGRTLSLNIGTSYNSSEGNSELTSTSNVFTFPDTTVQYDQQTETTSDGLTLSGNLMYTEPLGKIGQLYLNYSPSINNYNSERITESRDMAVQSDYAVDSALSNRFDNEITVQRGGAGLRFRGEKFSAMLGANYQYSTLNSSQTFPYSFSINRDFNNILPMAMLMYRFSRTKNLRLFYRTNTDVPSINQLQNVIDNSNPLQLRMGNPLLEQSFSHTAVARYSATNTEKSTTFFVMTSATNTQNYIGNASYIARRDSLLQDDIVLYQGAQLISYDNFDDYWNVRTFLTYGFPVTLLKSNLNLTGGFIYNRTPGSVNGALNISNTYNVNGGLVLGSNISEKVDFTLAYNANYNIVENTLQPQLDNNYFYQTASARINLLPWKGLVLNTDLNYNYYSGLGQDFNQDFLLWNASIGYKFLKNDALTVRLYAYDILNQNTSVGRTVTETYIEDNNTRVLNRYFMLQLTYNIRNFTVKK